MDEEYDVIVLGTGLTVSCIEICEYQAVQSDVEKWVCGILRLPPAGHRSGRVIIASRQRFGH